MTRAQRIQPSAGRDVYADAVDAAVLSYLAGYGGCGGLSWVVDELRGGFTATEIRSAIRRLVRAGRLEMEPIDNGAVWLRVRRAAR